jgi:hypothetical protein
MGKGLQAKERTCELKRQPRSATEGDAVEDSSNSSNCGIAHRSNGWPDPGPRGEANWKRWDLMQSRMGIGQTRAQQLPLTPFADTGLKWQPDVGI